MNADYVCIFDEWNIFLTSHRDILMKRTTCIITDLYLLRRIIDLHLLRRTFKYKSALINNKNQLIHFLSCLFSMNFFCHAYWKCFYYYYAIIYECQFVD